MNRLLALALFIIIIVNKNVAQPFCHLTEYGENEGLSQWHVTQIVQDKQGMIWFSTWNGLNRYDGNEFVCFKSKPGDGCEMYTDRIRNIWLDGNGNIQCEVDNGSFVFNTKTYRFSKTDSIMRTGRRSMSLISKDKYAYTDHYGTEWHISKGGSISYLDKDEGKTVDYPLEGMPEDIKFCFEDKQGNVWMLGNYNIFKLSFGIRPTATVPLANGGQVRGFMVDNKNRWFVANRDDKSIAVFDADNRLMGYLDKSGKVKSGLCTFDCPVYCMTQTSDGTIWIGSKPKGLFRLTETGDNMFSVKKIEGLSSDNVYDIKEDSLGRLWIATLGGGINCMTDIHEDNPTVYNLNNKLPNHPMNEFLKVRNLLPLGDSTIIATTTEGLIVINVDNNNISNSIFHLHKRNANRANSLSCNATMFAMKDYKGRIFICTESGGINMITSTNLNSDTLSFRHYNMENGLPTDVMLSATPFGKELMVVCSNRLLILNPEDGTHTAYDNSFLKQSCRFSDGQPVKLADGRWLFGTHDGAFTICPDIIKKSDFTPPIALTRLVVENKAPQVAVNGLDTLILNSDERSFTINFSALDYSYDGTISYAFRLMQDNETEWNIIGNNHSVTLLDLAPDTYTLQIRSTNSDGVWTDNIRQLTIVVTPQWHQTLLARVLFIVAALAVLGLIVFTLVYIKRLRKRQRETLEAYLALLSSHEDIRATDNEGAATADSILPSLGGAGGGPSPEDEAFMRRIMDFVEKNISNADVNIGDMTEAAAVSRSGLQRKIKQMMGVTPLDFLREARIKRACQLLENSNKSISDIAYECGFSDPKYFSRSFKTSTGKSPSDYRR